MSLFKYITVIHNMGFIIILILRCSKFIERYWFLIFQKKIKKIYTEYEHKQGNLKFTIYFLKMPSVVIKICFFFWRFGSFPMKKNIKTRFNYNNKCQTTLCCITKRKQEIQAWAQSLLQTKKIEILRQFQQLPLASHMQRQNPKTCWIHW